MASIEFLPERLNRPPVVFRGLTTAELGLSFVAGSIFGLVLGIALAIGFGTWVLAPSALLVFGFAAVWLSGGRLAAKKRGRAQMWFYRAIQMRLTLSPLASLFETFGLADRRLILRESHWSVRRK
ncbi:TIGR03750 family conjugal transfer protein [Stutzerimonas stutzeri]